MCAWGLLYCFALLLYMFKIFHIETLKIGKESSEDEGCSVDHYSASSIGHRSLASLPLGFPVPPLHLIFLISLPRSSLVALAPLLLSQLLLLFFASPPLTLVIPFIPL